MTHFIQLHALVSYPPSNLNRDDLGRPKTAIMGGANRLRISSQSLKRAWRSSAIFDDIAKGVRTKKIGLEAFEKLSKFPTLSPSERYDIAKNIAQVFGKLKSDSLESETLVFISNNELARINAVIEGFKNGIGSAIEETNELGIKIFKLLISEINSSMIELINMMKCNNSPTLLDKDWEKILKEQIKKFTSEADKHPYDFLNKMVGDDGWIDDIQGDVETTDDKIELFLAQEFVKQTKNILSKLSFGACLGGRSAKDTAYGLLKHKDHITLCKSWEEQVGLWVAEVSSSEDNEFTSADNIEKLKLAISPVAVAKSSILSNERIDVDIALFGRMLASSPAYKVEAAAQVAHAITVHAVKVDDDYFTAVDDLNKHDEDAGAAHIGETGFASGVFYLYVCINKTLLCENLQNDSELVNKTLAAFVESMTKVSPTGKQNSFASRAYTSYLLAEKGTQQPRSLSVAFLKPVQGQDILDDAVEKLIQQCDSFDKVYGVCADERKSYLVTAEKTKDSLSEVIASLKALKPVQGNDLLNDAVKNLTSQYENIVKDNGADEKKHEKSEGSLSEIIGFLTAGEPCSNT